MKIELLPVIEVNYNNQGIEVPKYPYWKNQDIWFEYRKKTYKKAGFIDILKPYLKGSPFFNPKQITDNNLKKIIIDHTEGFRIGEYERDQVCCLFGGFVLKKNGEDKYFPQCCGDLGDLKFWKNISEGKNSFHEGHPVPDIKFKLDKIFFDFSVEAYDENFQPTPPDKLLEITKKDLGVAVENAKLELNILAERIIEINKKAGLEIERIDDLLIWNNPNIK